MSLAAVIATHSMPAYRSMNRERSAGVDYTTNQLYASSTTGGKYARGITNAHSFGAERYAGAIESVSFFRNRFCDQATGRWTQEDPLGVAAGTNMSTNRTNVQTELFLFLTPHIIASDDDAERLREEIENGAEILRRELPAERSLIPPKSATGGDPPPSLSVPLNP